MTSQTWKHLSLFREAPIKRQLDLLADFVVESAQSMVQVIPQDIDQFDDRLEIYAKDAGITVEQARANVKTTVNNRLPEAIEKFNL